MLYIQKRLFRSSDSEDKSSKKSFLPIVLVLSNLNSKTPIRIIDISKCRTNFPRFNVFLLFLNVIFESSNEQLELS